MKKLFIVIIIFFLSLSYLYSLEIQDGRIKLKLDETSGRFTAYYLNDIIKNTYTSFLADQDSRTTVLSILADNKVYRMGESYDFKQSLNKISNGAEYIWESSMLRVSEVFSFIQSSASPVSDGFQIKITVDNISETDISVGIQYLFDTYLGEKSNKHFYTNTIKNIQKETVLSGSMPFYWVSSNIKDNATIELQGMLKTAGATTPDKVIFANWKRLNDSNWQYESNSSRNFNLLPYSINDSAVTYCFNPLKILRGGKREIILMMGNYSKEGFSRISSDTDTEITELFNQTFTQEKPAEDPLTAIKTDLLTVDDLLNKIDKMLNSDNKYTSEEISLLYRILEKLNIRKNLYTKE